MTEKSARFTDKVENVILWPKQTLTIIWYLPFRVGPRCNQSQRFRGYCVWMRLWANCGQAWFVQKVSYDLEELKFNELI
jgi:hypothetical protein